MRASAGVLRSGARSAAARRTITIVFKKKSSADLTLADPRVVACERRHQVEQRVAGGDEEEVEHPEAAGRSGRAARRGTTRARPRGAAAGPRSVDEREHRHVGDEGDASSRKSTVNEPGLETLRDQPAREAAEPDAEVHRHALLREGGVAPVGGRQARDQRRLARPEARAARALDRDQGERLPRLRARAGTGRCRPPAARGRRRGPGAARGGRRAVPAAIPAVELRRRRRSRRPGRQMPSPNPRTSWR